MPQCSFVKADKTRCRSNCISGSQYCFFHDPETRDAHRAATVAGGKERSKPAPTLPPDTPDLPLNNVGDVAAALSQTINQVRTGKIGVNVANCIGLLCGSLIKALEGSEHERRISELEARRGVKR